MPGATLSNKDSLLHEVYLAGVHDQLTNHSEVFSNCYEDSKKKFTGRRIRESIRNKRPAGGGAIAYNAASVPSPSTSGHAEWIIDRATIADVLAIDWNIMHASEGDSYSSALKEEMSSLADYQKVRFDRIAVGDGSGYLSDITITTSTTAGSALVFTVSGKKYLSYFEEGMRFEFYSDRTNASTKRTNPTQGYYEASTVGEASGTITVTCTSDSLMPASGEPTTGDYIAHHGAIANLALESNTDHGGNEFMGLRGHISNANPPMVMNAPNAQSADTYQGINRTTNRWAHSTVVDGSGQTLNLDLVTRVADDISKHGGGSGAEGVTKILANHDQIRYYLNTLTPQERYPNEGATGDFKSGAKTTFKRSKGPMIGERESYKNRFVENDRAYLLGGGLKKYWLRKLAFANKTGSMWVQDPSGAMRYLAKCYGYVATGCTSPNRSGVITGLSTP